MAPMMNGIKIKLERCGSSLSICTYDRKHGRSHNFYLNMETVTEWVQQGMDGTFYDHDIWSYLSAHKNSDGVRFSISWLSGSDEALHGHVQVFVLPCGMLEIALEEEGVWHRLYLAKSTRPSMDFSAAGKSLCYIAGNKQYRRAFAKEIAKCFNWRSSKSITFYSDTPQGSFYFEENDGHGVCGGFILHQGTEKTQAGNYEKVYFSMHT